MAIPTNGLVFHAPLDSDKATAETGQTLTKTGSVNYTTIEGSQCASFSGGKILIPDFDLAGLSDYAISAWMILTTEPSNSNTYVIFANATAGDYWRPAISANDGYGDNKGNQLGAALRNTTTGDQGSRLLMFSSVKNPVGVWVNVILNYSATSGVVNLYLNQDIVATYNTGITAISATTGSSAIGGTPMAETATYNFSGGIKGVRVYNRSLTSTEIGALYNEFNATEPGNSGTTGILTNGLFLSSQTPKINQRGLLIDNKFFIPLVDSAGGAGEYYRCASVDTTAKTWTGYKATLTNGVYAFESTLTTGLTYTSVTPAVNSIYSADGLVSVCALWDGIPVDGLVLYAPLEASAASAQVGGQSITETSITYSMDTAMLGNVATFNGTSSKILLGTSNLPSGSTQRTISFWVNAGGTESHVFNHGVLADRLLFYLEGAYFTLIGGGGQITCPTACVFGNWYHIFITVGASDTSLYVNNALIGTMVRPNNSLNPLYLGTNFLGNSNCFDGKMASLRIYNTALGADERASLYNEHSKAVSS